MPFAHWLFDVNVKLFKCFGFRFFARNSLVENRRWFLRHFQTIQQNERSELKIESVIKSIGRMSFHRIYCNHFCSIFIFFSSKQQGKPEAEKFELKIGKAQKIVSHSSLCDKAVYLPSSNGGFIAKNENYQFIFELFWLSTKFITLIIFELTWLRSIWRMRQNDELKFFRRTVDEQPTNGIGLP